jgi:integrase
MAVKIYLVKRQLRKRQRNGRTKYHWIMRWQDPDSGEWQCETTGTADKPRAKALQDSKWDELNRAIEPTTETISGVQPLPAAEEKPRLNWQDCKTALQRAMQADNLRPSYVSDAVLMLESVRRMFPDVTSPADLTAELANEYKRRRAEGAAEVQETDVRKRRTQAHTAASPWTIRGDLSTLKAIFGKWLGKECGLLDALANPFANVKPPRCDDPDVRIVSAQEIADLFAWLGQRWNNWQLPMIYLDVAGTTGWRATEIASMKTDDLLDDGFIRVAAESSKTRRHKHGWLPPILHGALRACASDGWAFGRFAGDLRRLLILWKRRPHHAARIKDFSPGRLVGWLQDELRRFNDGKAKVAATANPAATWEPFTLHDFRRTAITAPQMSGTSEKETSIMVGATPEVIRRHYERMNQQVIAQRAVERRIAVEGPTTGRIQLHQSLRAGCARTKNDPVDTVEKERKTITA